MGLHKIIAENRVVLVDFMSSWCPPCRVMAPIIDDISENSKFLVVKVDTEENKELASQFNISKIPTFKIFVDGQEKETFFGVQTKDFILEKIELYID